MRRRRTESAPDLNNRDAKALVPRWANASAGLCLNAEGSGGFHRLGSNALPDG